MNMAVWESCDKAPADITGPTSEVEHCSGKRVAKALADQLNELIMRLAEIGARIRQRLLRFIHEFGFGDALHVG